MKGQFMLISSILIGFIVISTASTISQVQEKEYKSDDLGKTVKMVEEAASKVDHTDEREVENFIEMVSMISGYQTETKHWQAQSCFNVTLTTSDKQARLTCIN